MGVDPVRVTGVPPTVGTVESLRDSNDRTGGGDLTGRTSGYLSGDRGYPTTTGVGAGSGTLLVVGPYCPVDVGTGPPKSPNCRFFPRQTGRLHRCRPCAPGVPGPPRTDPGSGLGVRGRSLDPGTHPARGEDGPGGSSITTSTTFWSSFFRTAPSSTLAMSVNPVPQVWIKYRCTRRQLARRRLWAIRPRPHRELGVGGAVRAPYL